MMKQLRGQRSSVCHMPPVCGRFPMLANDVLNRFEEINTHSENQEKDAAEVRKVKERG